ncbi:hypothetical protein WPS_07010 [Vulcanimicrobium alpinum]|uniref:Lipoprotein n=1 Tax=Vulcanimicrobium alpinum TaxID=3016050 RepID=A0AAN1XUW7_UNVUL|nr:hypothetical protein [Vulcanimicrobium alpinum]BDE05425.1 hypothetical protein WPS_07010 [Vulcanimicrobium alpinum]
MRKVLLPAAALIALAAGGCASPSATSPQTLADETTRAVYDVDMERATAHMDDALKAEVTRASIGQISDQMHALGGYQGLKPSSSDPDKGRYDYEAAFEKGTAVVHIRIDPNQKLGAYKIDVPRG